MRRNTRISDDEDKRNKEKVGDSVQRVLDSGRIKTQWEKTCHKQDRAEVEAIMKFLK